VLIVRTASASVLFYELVIGIQNTKYFPIKSVMEVILKVYIYIRQLRNQMQIVKTDGFS
jgi:hypothetical protein